MFVVHRACQQTLAKTCATSRESRRALGRPRNAIFTSTSSRVRRRTSVMSRLPQSDRSIFDADALFVALDEQRRTRGLTWAQTARAISDQFRDSAARPISPSTITGMRERSTLEGDGVLQMLRWLGRSPESFVPGHSGGEPLPDVPTDRILRFDSKAIYEKLNTRRIERGLTWAAVAAEIPGVSAESLTKSGRVGFSQAVRLAAWLGCSVASLTWASAR